MHKHRRDCRSICEANGLNVLHVEHRSKHLAVVCEEGMIDDHHARHTERPSLAS